MITGFLIQIFTAFVSFMIGFLPVISLPAGWVDSVNLIWDYVNALNFLYPVTTLLQVLLVALGFHVAIMGLRLVMYIIHLVRGR